MRANSILISGLAGSACLVAWTVPATAELSSYATSSTDISGTTGASADSLGAPDYRFVNDLGLGFGGTSTEVFGVGESVELSFPVPLRNIPTQHDLVLSAFVGGLGATDNANVQVEASSDGTNYSIVGTFDTAEARDRSQDRQENDFEGVKHFFVEFGTEDHVVSIRLTNLMGTAEGLRLDAVEGLHPEVDSSHAFEIRFDRSRPDSFGFFFVRLKNISDSGGVPIRELRITRSPEPLADFDNTIHSILGVDGDFICVENCVANAGPGVPFSRHVWSVDGLVEAPPGVGLDAGKQAAHPRNFSFDTDHTDYMTGMSFKVTFVDDFVHEFTYDDDVMKVVGSLYQKYLYFSDTPVESWNRPTDYYQFVLDETIVPRVPSLSVSAHWILAVLTTFVGWLLIRALHRDRSPGASVRDTLSGSTG